MLKIEPLILLQAKAELARLVAKPLEPASTVALHLVHDEMVRNYKLATINPEGKPWDSQDFASAALILIHSWHITQPDAAGQDVSVPTAFQLMTWVIDWRDRISRWLSDDHLFETNASWRQVNQFLDVWYEQVVECSIPYGRGCAAWLKNQNLIPTEVATTFDNYSNRTVVASN